MRRRTSFVGGVSLLVVAMTAVGATAGPGSTWHRASPAVTARVAAARARGYVQMPSYLAAKAAADRAWRAGALRSPAPAGSAAVEAPAVTQSFEGPHDPLVAPSDSVGAVGPTRYVNLVNSMYQIFDRTTPVPVTLSTGPLSSFTTVSADQFGLFDPQIIWDSTTGRFYYVMDDIVCGAVACTDHEDFKLAFGFSKTASPSTPQDWCHYQTDFGGTYGTNGNFPDYPKLGDNRDFVLIGINAYLHLETFTGSDIGWIAKPPPGAITTCPAQNTLQQGIVTNVKDPDGNTAFTPVPANQIDTNGAGYVLSSVDLGEPGDPGESRGVIPSGNTLTQFKVTRNADGTARIPSVGRSIQVPSYAIPPSAPQKGSQTTLDTLDGRLTNAQHLVDPRSGRFVLLTQHTVAGGAGSEVRWYRINPRRLKVRSFRVADPELFTFNAAVSSDRRFDGTAAAFGDSVVVGFDTSSPNAFEAIRMVSKVGSGPQSAFVNVHASDAADEDFTCFDDNGDPATCRWGDYGAASPDPASDPAGPHGVVWSTSMWTTQGDPVLGTNYWRSWNWAATP